MVNNFVIQFRVVYMLQQNPPEISLKSVDYLIIDESDKLFEAGERGFRDLQDECELNVSLASALCV